MAIDNTSPNVDEYFVGKSIVTLKPDTTWYDVGNVPEFEFTPTAEELAHFSSRAGLKSRDRTIVVERGGDVRIILEEATSFNMAIIMLGDLVVTPGATTPEDLHVIDILTKSAYSAAVRSQGQNIVGARWNFQFEKADFIPSGAIGVISEEWGSFEINGRLAAVAGKFGTARRMAGGGDPGWAT